MTTMNIDTMVERTEDAYSFDRYGKNGWRGAILTLRLHGLDDRQVEAFLRSKHMRWAGDYDAKRTYGRHNGQTVKEYIAQDPRSISPEELAELVAGTF